MPKIQALDPLDYVISMPQRHRMSQAVEVYDVVLVGTSLAHSILAASLNKLDVLHLDARDSYGDLDGNVPFALFQAASTAAVLTAETEALLPSGLTNLKLIPGSSSQALEPARHYNIELTPRVLFANSPLIDNLRDAGVQDYLEFRALSDFYLYDASNKALKRVPSSKEDIFTDKAMPLLTKRRLMKFVKACADEEEVPSELLEQPAEEALATQWKLSSPHIEALVYTLGRSPNALTSLAQCMNHVRRHVTSIGRLAGDFPAVSAVYGTGSELCQAFCRKAAVKGATYRLATEMRQMDEDGTCLLSDEETRIKTRWFIRSARFTKRVRAIRRILILSVDAESWQSSGNGGEGVIVAIPPSALGEANKLAVHAQILGHGSGACPASQTVLHLEVMIADMVEEGQWILDAAQGLLLGCANQAMEVIAGIQYCVLEQESPAVEAAHNDVCTIETRTTGDYAELVAEAKRVHTLITGTPDTFLPPHEMQGEEESNGM
jgi:RAB protein geranylgeranyltransferase component A